MQRYPGRLHSLLTKLPLAALILFIALFQAGCRSDSGVLPQYSGQFSFLKSSAVVEASIDNFIVVDVLVNGEAGRFIIDTGADVFVVSPSFAERAGLEPRGSAFISTVVGVSQTELRRIADFRFANVVGQNIEAVVLELSDFDGAIGLPLFRNALVSIDYQQQTIAVGNPSELQLDFAGNEEKSQIFDLNDFVIEGLTVNGKTVGPLRIDSGSSGGIHVSGDKLEGILEGVETTKATTFTAANGSLPGTAFIAEEVEFGKFSLQDQFVVYQDTPIETGLLGNLVLQQYTIGFDYSRSQVFFFRERKIRYGLTKSGREKGKVFIQAQN
jgi:predicted aspartyl protease